MLYRHNGYIPDAKKYPYIRTQYTADPTNRVSAQGGIGLHHQIGTGHESKYLYGVPSVVELDRLFGSNVGFCEHYQKNVVIDPNGQVSISYLDLSGRTIATSMAGNAPENTLALESLPTVWDTLTENLVLFNKTQNSSLEMSRSIVVAEAAYFTFDYSLSPGQIADSCLENVCYDCIYDLTISLTNSCGVELLDGDENTGGIQPLKRVIGRPLALLDTACDDPLLEYSFEEDNTLPAEVKVWLEPGNYVVTKIMTVNDSAFEYYLEKYLAESSCKKTLDQFISEAISEIDFSGCELDCETCESSLGSFSNFSDSFMTILGVAHFAALSPADTTFIRDVYESRLAYCRLMCDSVDPCENIYTLLENDILEGGQYYDSLTTVEAHPEYCHYLNCVAEKSAQVYKNAMLEIESFDTALKYGYLDPLGMHSVYTDDNLDPFYVGRTNLRDSAINALNKFVRLSSGPDVFLTAWEVPVYIYQGRDITGVSAIKLFVEGTPMSDLANEDCNSYKDVMWAAFRTAYLMTRDSLMENKFSGCYSTSIPLNKARLFEKTRAYKTELNAEEGDDDEIIENGFTNACDTSCLAYVEYWLEQLSECNMDSLIDLSSSDSAVYKAMLNAMVTVCKKGCDVNNPEGASTVKPGTTTGGEAKSLGEVLIQYGIYLKDICDSNLLDFPLPWNESNLFLENDTFNCDNFFDSCIAITTDANLKSVLKQMAIDKSDSICSNCLSCEDFYTGFKTYYTIYPDRTFDNYRDYELFENVLNRYFRYNLTSFEYLDFMYECAGLSDSTLSDSVIIRKYYDAYRVYDPTNNTFTQHTPTRYKDLIQPGIPENTKDWQWASINEIYQINTPNNYLDTCTCRKLLEADLGRGETPLSEHIQSLFGSECIFTNLELILTVCRKAIALEEDLSDNFNATPRVWTTFQFQALKEEMAIIVLEAGNANSLLIPTGCGDLCGSEQVPDTSTIEFLTWQPIPCDSIIKYARLRWDPMDDAAWKKMLFTTPDSAFALANFLDDKYDSWSPYNRSNYRDQVENETDGPDEEKERIIRDFLARLAQCYYSSLGTGTEDLANGCSTGCYQASAHTLLLKNYLNNLLYDSPSKYRHFLTTDDYYKVPYGFETYYNTGLYEGSSDSSLKYKMTHWSYHKLASYIEDTNDVQHLLHLEFIDKSNVNRFTKLVKFVAIYPLANGCNTWTNRFLAKAIIDNPRTVIIDTTWLWGTFDSVNLIVKCGRRLCNRIFFPSVVDSGDCAENLIFTARFYAEYRYNKYLDSLKAEFRSNYYNKCMAAAVNTETFTMSWRARTYHHTLYYYDQAGNLIQTVPPKGVFPITDKTTLGNVDLNRRTGSGTPYYPAHTLYTRYTYNTLNQLVWQSTPDGGASQFWYDKVGRLVVSQNAEQALSAVGKEYFSYTLYDSLGRIVEVGQVEKPDTTSSVIISDMASLAGWLASGIKEQITKTYYDGSVYTVTGFTQNNLRGRVSASTIQKLPGSEYDQAVHYSYDIHGNVQSMVREIKELEILQQSLKRIDYVYDLISGNVNKVIYQKDKVDQYQHKYSYDADNRLVEAYTGTNEVFWDRDAAYSYYLHGPLARTELGQLKVQGVDYAYTIHGWLKGVNSTTLDSTRDIGRDADSMRIITGVDSFRSNPNRYVAKDVFGYTLGYYGSDFSSIRTYSNEAFFDLNQTSSTFYAGSSDLYNGNIARMVTAIKPFMQDGASPIGKAFKYDQLNRLKSADVFTNANLSGNSWNTSGNADGRWAETFSYDANGNITKLKRRGNKPDTLAMDSLDYYYTSNTNKLSYVDDYVPDEHYDNDIDDQSTGNYDYDAIGNLVKDEREEIYDISWTVYGKIQSIIRNTESEKPNLSFGYTPDGHRSIKSVITDSAWGADKSIYIHDAQGNIMAVYTMPIFKLLDTAALDFEAINTQLLDQVGNSAFADFIVDDLDIVTLMANNGNYDVPGDYRTAIATASGSLEEALMMTLEPSGFFAAHSGLIGDVLTNYYSGVEVLDVLLEGKTQSQILGDVIGNKYNETAFHTYLMGMFGNSWLQALHTYNAVDFESFYVSAMNNNSQIPTTGQSYSFMENDLTTLLTSIQLETELAGLLTNNYVFHAFNNYFSSVDINQMLSGYIDFTSVILTVYSESDLIDWAILYDLEKLWTEALNYHDVSTVLNWYQSNDASQFLKKSIIILPGYVNTLLGSTTMSISEYLAWIETYFLSTEYNYLCSALKENYFRPGTSYQLAEWHLYGSGRLGIYQENKLMAQYYDSTLTTEVYQTRITYHSLGKRRYELSNHLGNVLVTVSDKRVAICTDSQTVAYYRAEIITAQDYYAFGSVMEGRSFVGDTSGWYRFGFNGKEKDDEVSGAGNQYDYGFRIYNPHVGKFLSVDPKIYSFPMYSSYQYAGNKPIVAIDLDGLEDVWVHQLEMGDGTRITMMYNRDDHKFEEVVNSFCSSMGLDRSKIPSTGLVHTFAIQDEFQGPLSQIRYDYTPTAVIHPDNSIVNTIKRFGSELDDYHNKIYGQKGFVKFTDDAEKTLKDGGTWVKAGSLVATVLYGPAVGSAVYRVGNAMENISEYIGMFKAMDKGDWTKAGIKASALVAGEFKDKRLKKIAIQKGLKGEEKLGATIMGDIVIDELKKSAEKLTEKKED
jgi:RHS repeat-associated protein